MHFFKLLNIKNLKAQKLLDSKLEIFCKKNFNDEKKIISQFMDYKKLLINENTKMNLIGKSTIDNFDQRHQLQPCAL